MSISHFIAGCCGGISGVIVGYPFDTIKVKMQTQSMYSNYTSGFDCFRKTLYKEGIRGFYRGMSSPLFGAAIFKTLNFGIYGTILNHLDDQTSNRNIMLAGTMSSICCGTILVPIDRIKILMQTHTTCYKNPIDVIHSNSIKSLMSTGFTATIARETIFGMTYFMIFKTTKSLINQNNHENGRMYSFMKLVVSGAITGCLSWSIVYPIDVIKSKIQSKIKNNRFIFIHSIKEHYRREGIRGFYKGWRATVVRALPTHAAVLTVYQLVYAKINK